MKRSCWRCGGRWLLADDDFGARCGYCARPQFVRDLPPLPDVAKDMAEVPTAPCQWCKQPMLMLWSARRYCSRACKARDGNARRQRSKPWRELVLR